MNVPTEITALGSARQQARANKDFALADKLRDQILAHGFEILDVPGGFEFREKSPFAQYARIGDFRHVSETKFDATIAIIVDGFCDDAAIAVKAAQGHTSEKIAIVVLVVGTPDATALTPVLNSRTVVVQITGGVGWGEAANALLKAAPSSYVFIMDSSTIFDGDAVTPALELLQRNEFVAVGWRGGLINIEDEWRSVDDKGPGEVDVLFSYFLGINREQALEAGAFNIRAVYYRNADIEFGLRLRQAHGRLWQLDLPLHQERHHGYHDTDPTYRDEQSKKNYDRILDRFRGKTEILSPRR